MTTCKHGRPFLLSGFSSRIEAHGATGGLVSSVAEAIRESLHDEVDERKRTRRLEQFDLADVDAAIERGLKAAL